MNVVAEVHKRHRQRLKMGRSGYRLRKPTKILFPHQIEAEYRQKLAHISSTFFTMLFNRIAPVVKRAFATVNRQIPASARRDAADDFDGPKIVSVGLVCGDHLLTGKRRDNNLWVSPGGHMDPGEDPREAAIREVAEETGIEYPLELEKIFERVVTSHRTGKDFKVYAFVARLPMQFQASNANDPDREIDEWRWVKISDSTPELMAESRHAKDDAIVNYLLGPKAKGRLDAADDWADDVNDAFDDAAGDWQDLFSDQQAQEVARAYGDRVSKFNQKQVQRSIERMVGFDVFFGEQWLKGQMDAFAHANADLITKMTDDLRSDVQGVVFRGLQAGSRWEDMVGDIRERGRVSESRARLIGRDQTSKLNGQLSKLRQTEVGIEKYRWQGVMDDRERDSHVEREGEVYEWGGGDIEPGEEINCRCWAEPVIELPQALDEAA